MINLDNNEFLEEHEIKLLDKKRLDKLFDNYKSIRHKVKLYNFVTHKSIPISMMF